MEKASGPTLGEERGVKSSSTLASVLTLEKGGAGVEPSGI